MSIWAQVLILVGCFILGWTPLFSLFYWSEKTIPYKLQTGTSKFSWFGLIYMLYLGLEITRGITITYVVHQWLILDQDVLFGIGLFMIGLRFQPKVPMHIKSPFWPSLFGVIAGLSLWLCPLILMAALFTHLLRYSPIIVWSITGILIILIDALINFNSLYILLNILIIIIIISGYFSLNYFTRTDTNVKDRSKAFD